MAFKRRQPLNRIAPGAFVLLSISVAILALLGMRSLPHVDAFSWQNQTIAADNSAFELAFSQPMEPSSVSENLEIEPALPGKVSWRGRQMVYQLDRPAPYGEAYKVVLPEAKTSAVGSQDGAAIEPFEGEFHTRDRAFAYIGVDEEEAGRLVMFNLTRKEKTLLTPADQIVLDFEVYPERDRILFSSVSESPGSNRIAMTQLYTVSTGLGDASLHPSWQFWRRGQSSEAGETKLVLDNREFQNLKFDLSPDGKTIVIQRVSQIDPSDYGPWVIQSGQPPRKLTTEPGGDFKIGPDSVSLILQQGQGTTVLPLMQNISVAEASQLLDFLPEYGMTVDITDDGSAAAFVSFNQNNPEQGFTQSLYWISSAGEERSLLQTDGAILTAQFSKDNQILYCLVNRLIQDSSEPTTESKAQPQAFDPEGFNPEALDSGFLDIGNRGEADDRRDDANDSDESESAADDESNYSVHLKAQYIPYLTAINVETGDEQLLLEMPPQPEITVSLSPDSLAILFDEVLVSDAQAAEMSGDVADGDSAVPTHRLWLLPLFSSPEDRLSGTPTALPPTQLEIAGRRPVWLP